MKTAFEVRHGMPIHIQEEQKRERLLNEIEKDILSAAKKDNTSVTVWLSLEDYKIIENDLKNLGYMVDNILGCETMYDWWYKEELIIKYRPDYRPQHDDENRTYLFPYRIYW